MEKNHTLGEQTPERIAILRALQLGDLLCTVPALRALRDAKPNAQITLVGLPWARSFVHRFSHYLDDFLTLPGFPGLPEVEPQINRLPSFLSEIQWLHYDLALQMQGSGAITNPLIALFGAKNTAGYYIPGQYCPDEERFIPYPEHEHEIHKHLILMDSLGAASLGDHLEFPFTDKDWTEYSVLERRCHLEPGSYAVVHPGARALERRWAPERFAEVANGLVERGLRVVLTGTHREAHLTNAVAGMMKYPATNVAGQTSLGSLAALLSNSRVLVCNDTGVSHLAAALQIPSVVLFSDSDPNRWAPLNKALHRTVASAYTAHPDLVLDEVEQVLQEVRVYVHG